MKNDYQKSKLSRIGILFFNGCCFMRTANVLLNNPNAFGTDCNQFAVAVVNGMMAAELFLKFLSAYDRPTKKEASIETSFKKQHNLNSLFKTLSQSRKRQIISELELVGCERKRFYRFRAVIRSAEKEKQSPKRKNGDVVNWRYLIIDHKNKYNFDLNTMVQLNEVLYSLSQRIINAAEIVFKFPQMSSPMLDVISSEIINTHFISDEKPEQDN